MLEKRKATRTILLSEDEEDDISQKRSKEMLEERSTEEKFEKWAKGFSQKYGVSPNPKSQKGTSIVY